MLAQFKKKNSTMAGNYTKTNKNKPTTVSLKSGTSRLEKSKVLPCSM